MAEHTRPQVDIGAKVRPAWYDQKLVDYLPFARKCANRRAGADDADEIVQDAYVDALNRWHMYDAANYRFGTWVFQLVRCAASNRRVKARAKKRAGSEWSMDTDETADRSDDARGRDNSWLPSVSAIQEDYTELSAVLRNLSGTRDSDALMRLAMGDDMTVIGKDMGLSRQRVFQLIERERGRLRSAAGRVAA